MGAAREMGKSEALGQGGVTARITQGLPAHPVGAGNASCCFVSCAAAATPARDPMCCRWCLTLLVLRMVGRRRMTEYEPGDRWPVHPKAWWREVIELAKLRGWRLRTSDGHAWGTLLCPQSCRVLIFSTGRGGESAAKTARLKIERCAHGAATPTTVALQHLSEAERLTEAATELIAHQACAADIEEMLQLANEALDAAQQQRLLGMIDTMPVVDDRPEFVLDEAEDRVRTAVSELSALAAPAAKPLRSRARGIRARIVELRRQLNI